MVRRPKYLRAGPHKYKLLFTKEGLPDDEDGYWSMEREEIGINPDQNESNMQETLIHECLHAASFHAGHDLEEAQVTAIALLMAQMLGPFLKKI